MAWGESKAWMRGSAHQKLYQSLLENAMQAPSRFALATRRAERPALSSSAGEFESCCPKERFAARHASAPSARHATRIGSFGPYAGSLILRLRYFSTSSALSTTLASYSGASSICSRSFSPQYL